MCRFVETIKLKDGVFYRLNLHQERVNKAFSACFPKVEPINIFESLNQYEIPQEGIFKCRLEYDTEVQLVEFISYKRREIRSLKLIDTDIESLAYKLEDRACYNAVFAQRGGCDDVLMIKNGLLTDTSYCNIALSDGNNWFTPRIPLLYGINRVDLIEKGIVFEKDIEVAEVKNYSKISLFNALIEFGEIVIDTNKIEY